MFITIKKDLFLMTATPDKTVRKHSLPSLTSRDFTVSDKSFI